MSARRDTASTFVHSQTEVPETSMDSFPKADLSKRIVAAILDAVLTVAVGFIPWLGGLLAMAYWLLRDGLDLDFMDHRSLGKKIMRLRPVTADGRTTDVADSIKRNWPLAFGGLAQFLAFVPFIGWLLLIPVFLIALGLGLVEVVLVITDPQGRRLGDRMAGTRVAEAMEEVR